jgi:FkbM family methyltransferase
MGLSTKQKTAVAGLVSRPVVGARRAVGKGPTMVSRRRGIAWNLDLREGIDLAIWLFGSFEPSTRRVYSRMVGPGDTVVDIGANVGAHTLQFSSIVGPAGRVVAIEPTEWAFTKLRANLDLNPDLAKRVHAEQAALVASPDDPLPEAIYASWPLRDGDDLHPTHRGRAVATSGARAATLDGLLAEAGVERIDLIKLDVDGAECAVLRGGAESLARHRPPILLELAPHVFEEAGSGIGELTEVLAGAGYSLRELGSNVPLPTDPQELAALVPEGGSINAVALNHSTV